MKLREGNVFTCVCDSVHRGMPGPGGCLVSGGCLVPGGWVPGLGGVSGPRGCLVETPLQRPLLQAVRILLECILVW